MKIYYPLQEVLLNLKPLDPTLFFLQQLHLYHEFQILTTKLKCFQLILINQIILTKTHVYHSF